MALTDVELAHRTEAGMALSTLVWRFPSARTSCSTAAVGGGLAESAWVVNAQVPHGYHRVDLAQHAEEIAAACRLRRTGVVMLTAVDVGRHHDCDVDGVRVTATVGVSEPVWAAEPAAGLLSGGTAGTVNVIVELPVPMSPAGLVNLVGTVTEAKCQAFLDAGVPGTGTPSDAVTIVCPTVGSTSAEAFGGPRSVWGSRVATATHRVITAGLAADEAPC